jgi:hypothetical protein
MGGHRDPAAPGGKPFGPMSSTKTMRNPHLHLFVCVLEAHPRPLRPLSIVCLQVARLTKELAQRGGGAPHHLKGQASARTPPSAAQAHIDARLSALLGRNNVSSVASEMQRLTSETGFRVHGLIDAESLRQTFLDNMAPFTHAKVGKAGGGRVGGARGGAGDNRPVPCMLSLYLYPSHAR